MKNFAIKIVLILGIALGGVMPMAAVATQLHQAARLNLIAPAVSLIADGADVDARDFISDTPLHQAAAWGSIDVATVLIANGADVNARNNDDWTPLDFATYVGVKNSKEMIALLKQHGAQ